ncbi:NADH-ubiquinone oxidoreductase-F iron-sulfur binding region domain-containing protein [Haladaptatus pallidirubidus]|uniref:NADH-ubiquinone oxidoreductase 51kDa subunit iron-sulphur binding domain-containing protein n=1 Tax=Haladaptatus pallidirubidus TaxID=1008152 RepID=A0AAV3UBX0_9EURY|nr:NADH-ubiquinone oxidoreductase-F iron-sulfur binding region domain-containing protein [Haladaptatus pallidirubidus]
MGTADVSDAPVLRVSGGVGRERATAVFDSARDEADAVSVVEVGPTGIEALAPLVSVTDDETTVFFANCTPERGRTLVSELESGAFPEDDAHAVVPHESDQSAPPVPNHGPLSVGRRNVLARCGWADPAKIQDNEPFVAERARDDPEEVLSQVAHFGLLGRGRGDARMDEPVAEEWNVARETDGEPVVVVNAGETDERNRTDQLLLEGDPISVLDGATAVAHVVGAEDVIVYSPESADKTQRRVREAVRVFQKADGTDDLTVQIFASPNQYIASEPTMALEALEGNDRLEARLRPPTPAKHGLYGRPTVVHTPRSFAQVRRMLLFPDEFDADDADPGTRLVAVTGDVAAPATIELPTGGSLSDCREVVSVDGEFKMACVGGQFGGLTRSLDRSPSAPALAGAHLGTDGAVELLNQSQCAVATAGTRAKFAEDENCGRCVPCREGSKQLVGMLRDVYSGEFADDALRELARTMRETSICYFGQSASRPVATAMDEFELEFHAHAEGRCPSGACEEAES